MLSSARYRLWVRLLLLTGAAALFVLGYLWGNRVQRDRTEPPAIGGVLIRPPGAVPDFRLQDSTGRTFDRGTLSAGWTLIAFGDLSESAGQLAVRRLIDAYNRVSDREDLYRALRLVLVTPDRSPESTGDLAALSPALYLVGGESAEVQRLADALGASPEEPSPLFVFAPGGYLIALLTDDRDGAGLAADLAALYEHADLLVPTPP